MYSIITDERALDDFLATLPPILPHEVFYACLFSRAKYGGDESQLARITARSPADLKQRLRCLECPLGSYSCPQESLAVYMTLNPHSLIKASRALLADLVTRIDGVFNPVSLAYTAIHRSTERKFYMDFDFDVETLPAIDLPAGSYRRLKTRGGYHVIVDLERITDTGNWYAKIVALGPDVRGTNCLTPIPGCTQGGFTPYFI